MIRCYLTLLTTCALCFVTTLQAQYVETFSTANKGYLINFVNDFSGVDWTMTSWDNQPPAAFGRDASDYFRTSGGVLAGIDFDQEVCWISPELNTSGVGDTFYFSVNLTWLGFDSGSEGVYDFIDVKYSINGGGYVQVPNKVGGGTHTIQYTTDTGHDGATNVAVFNLTGNSLQVQVCIKMDSDAELVTIDNFGTQRIGVTLGCSKPVLSKTVTNATCGNGAIDLSVSGGTPSYSYNWSNGPTTQDISGLSAGTYTVTVTDNIGCTQTTSATVGNAPIVLSKVVYNNSCPTDANGAIDVSVSGGTAPFTYAWSNGPTTQDVSGIAPGTYTVTATDAAGCTATTSATVGTASAGPYIETFSIPNKGYRTGNVDDFFGINWSMTAWGAGRDASDYFNTTGAGVLEAIDFDEEVCWVGPLLDISTSSPASVTADLSWTGFDSGTPGDYINLQYSVDGGSYTTVPNQFGGGANGTVNYALNTNNSGSGTISVGGITGNSLRIRLCVNMNANEEKVTIDNVTVPQTVSLACVTPEVSIVSVTNVLCNGGSTGAVNINVTDGTPPYSYAWSNGPTTEDLSGVSAGTYTVVVTDMAGLTATISATVTQPSALSLSTSVTNASCFGDTDGAIDLTVSGGTPPYSYAWSGGEPPIQDLSFLFADTYTVTVTDFNGCAKTTSATVNEPDPLFALGIENDVACNGGSTGSIDLFVFGGTPSYSYAWSSGPTTQDLSNIPAGTYTVTVTDANGCTWSTSATVSEPSAISLSTGITHVLCNGGNTGAIDLGVSGGTPGYSYAWSNGPTTQDISGLTAGTYTVTVTDNNGCTKTVSATVTQPAAGLLLSTSLTHVLCNGGSTGAIDLSVSGGTPSYSYAWSNGPTTQDISGLTAGTYTVTVTDANGCTATTSATVSENSAVVVDAGACQYVYLGYGSNCAHLTAVAAGGSGGYTYLWNPGGLSGASVEVCPENTTNYTVIATDVNGCTGTDAVTVEVVDVRCGPPNGGKVLLCHKEENKEKDKCVDAESVPDHLSHGDYLGACGTNPCAENNGGFQSGNNPLHKASSQATGSDDLDLYPNPASASLRVVWHSGQAATAQLEVFDISGQLVKTVSATSYAGQNAESLDVSGFRSGVYWLRLTNGQSQYTKRFVVFRD